MGMESRRDLFPDLEPSNDNFPLYQSFLEKYKLGMILNETMRLKYYNRLFPAMDAMRCTLSNNRSSTDIEDRTESVDKDDGSEQILASTINNNTDTIEEEEDAGTVEYEYDEESDENEENNQEEDGASESEYEYEYEYEYETDDEFGEGSDEQKDD